MIASIQGILLEVLSKPQQIRSYPRRKRLEEKEAIYDMFSRLVYGDDVEIIDERLADELELTRLSQLFQASNADVFLSPSEKLIEHETTAGPEMDSSPDWIDYYVVKLIEIGQLSTISDVSEQDCSKCGENIEDHPYRILEIHIRHNYHEARPKSKSDKLKELPTSYNYGKDLQSRFEISSLYEVTPLCKSCQVEMIQLVDVTQEMVVELVSAYI